MAKPAKIVSGLQPYPAYKPSGVEWLGKVPAHWEVRRLKTVCSMQSGDGITATSIEPRGYYPVYGGHGQRGYTSSYTHDGTFVLIGRQGALCGNVHIASGRFWASEHALVTTPNVGHSPEWLGAILEAMNLGQYSIAAAQPGLSLERVLELRMPVPDTSEQASIARYLDNADRRIRRCIQAKEKLVKLLEEQRQALINEAVTGRVDVRTGQPYPAYKPSGVEWLGDVPAHWEVRKLKSWLRINELVLPEDTDPNYTFDYVDIGAVGTGFLTADLARIRFRSAPSRARRVLRSGDTIVSTVRTYLKAVWSPKDPVENLIASTGFAVLTPPDGTASRFVGYLCQSDYFADRVTSESVGIAYPAIAETRLSALKVCVPPLSEQAAIARYLDHAERRIQRFVESEQRQIHLLNEYRSRLIADVVTGKLDVLQAASGLPNDLEDPGAIT